MDLVAASDKTALHFLTIRLHGGPGRMGSVDRAQYDAMRVPAERWKPPWLNTQRGSGTHLLPTGSEIPGFIVLNTGLGICVGLQDRLGKRRSMRATPNRGKDHKRDQTAREESHGNP